MLLVVQPNPFQPGQHESLQLDKPCTLDLLAPETDQPFIMLHNGVPVLRPDWPSTLVQGEDIATVLLLPAGGGGGKNALAIVATIAAVVLSAGVAFYVGSTPSLVGLVGSSGAYAVGAGAGAAVAMAGMALVNTLLPPPRAPSSQQTANAAAVSPTYSINAQGNLARYGQAIPVQYGRVRAYPDLATQPIVEYDSDGQYLNMLLVVGWGYFEYANGNALQDIYIGDNPLSAYNDVTYEWLNPGEKSSIVPENSWINPAFVQTELTEGNWSPDADANPADTVLKYAKVSVSAPSGAYVVSKDTGEFGLLGITFEIRGTPIDRVTGAATGAAQVLGTFGPIFSGNRQPWGRTFTVWPLAGWERMKVSVTVRLSTPGVNWEPVGQFYTAGVVGYLSEFGQEVNYPDVSMLAIRVRATEQLNSNTARQVSVDCIRKLPVYSGGAWSAQPQTTRKVAWAFADAVRNTVYGLGLTDSRLAINELVALAADAEDWQFNGRFDNQITAWEALTLIARTARARPYVQGGVVRLALDREQTVPTAMFNMRNIVRGSLQLEYIPPSEDNADIVEVEYLDETDWTPKSVAAKYDGTPQDIDDTEIEVQLFGITSRAKAFAEAWYLARANKYRRRVVRFTTEMEGYIPSPGDLISVSHDMPSWGVSGEIVAYDTTTRTATLSEPIDWAAASLQRMIINSEGNEASAPIGITRVGDDRVVALSAVPVIATGPKAGQNITISTDNTRERTRFVAGPANAYNRLAIVTDIRPTSINQIEIACTVDDQRVRTGPPPVIPPPPTKPPIYDQCLAPAVTGLAFGSIEPGRYSLVWQAPECAKSFDVEIGDNNEWTRVASQIGERTFSGTAPNNTWVRVRAYGDTVGPWSNSIQIVYGGPGSGDGLVPILDPPTCTEVWPLANGLEIHWTDVDSPYLGAVNVWISLTTDILDAQLLATVPANGTGNIGLGRPRTPAWVAVWGLEKEVLHYIWLQSVNSANVGGPVRATPDCSGTPFWSLEDLENDFDNSWLGQELASELQPITDAQTLLNQELAAEKARIDSLISQVANLEGLPEYDPNADYAKGDIVKYQGGLYAAYSDLTAGNHNSPPDKKYWNKVGDYTSLVDEITANAARITINEQNITNIDGEVNTISNSLNLVQASINDPTTGLSALSASYNSLNTRVTSNENLLSTHATLLNGIRSELDDPTNGLSAVANGINALSTRVTNAEGTLSSHGSRLNTLESSITSANTGITANANAINSVNTEVQANKNGISALTSQVNQLSASVGSGGNLLADVKFTSEIRTSGAVFWTIERSSTSVTADYATGTGSDPAPTYDTRLFVAGYEEEKTAVIRFTAGYTTSNYLGIRSDFIPIEGDKSYNFSVYISHIQNVNVYAHIYYYTESSSVGIGSFTSASGYGAFAQNQSLNNKRRISITGQAPTNAARARVLMFMRPRSDGNIGQAGFFRPMFAEVQDGVTTAPPWAPGEYPPLFATVRESGAVWMDDQGSGGATYTMKMRVKTTTDDKQIGWGMSVLPEAGGSLLGRMLVEVDRFAIRHPSRPTSPGTNDYPFFISGNVVYMRSAFIQDASITNAKIANAAITNAKIDNAAVDTLKVASASITGLKAALGDLNRAGTGAWQYCGQIDHPMYAGSSGIGVIACIYITNTSFVQHECRIRVRNFDRSDAVLGTGIFTIGPSSYNTPMSIVVTENIPRVGQNRLIVDVLASSQVQVRQWYIYGTGAQR